MNKCMVAVGVRPQRHAVLCSNDEDAGNRRKQRIFISATGRNVYQRFSLHYFRNSNATPHIDSFYIINYLICIVNVRYWIAANNVFEGCSVRRYYRGFPRCRRDTRTRTGFRGGGGGWKLFLNEHKTGWRQEDSNTASTVVQWDIIDKTKIPFWTFYYDNHQFFVILIVDASFSGI